MTPENTKRLTSICLAVLSVTLGFVAGLIEEAMPPKSRFPNIYGAFILLSLLAAIAIGVLAIIVGRSVKCKSGIVAGCIAVVLIALPFLLSHYLFVCTISDQRFSCKRGLQELHSAMEQYCNQNEGRLLNAKKWSDQLVESVGTKNVFNYQHWSGEITRGPNGELSNYGYNNNLDGYRLADIDRQTVLVFEAEPGWNQNGTSNILLPEGHPGYYVLIEGGAHFLFVGPDSTFTVKFIKNSEIGSLNWEK